jgi:hypothetical protein
VGTYGTLEEMRSYLKDATDANIPDVEVAWLAACNAVDMFCQRPFTVPTTATTRTFVPPMRGNLLAVPDIANTTGLVIVDDGTTLTAADYQLEVSPGQTNTTNTAGRQVPYQYVRLLSWGSWSTYDDGEATISITARWGWPAVPDEVDLAVRLLTKDFFESRNTRFGTFDGGDFAQRIRANAVVAQLLGPLRRSEAWGLA